MNFAENKRLWIQVAVLGGVIILAAAGYGFWGARQTAAHEAIADRLYALREGYAQEKAQAKAGDFQKADPKVLFPKTISGLEALDQEGSKAPAAQEARLWLAQLYSRHGQVDAAAAVYAHAADLAKGRLEKSAARVAYALALEAQGKKDQALKTLEQAVSDAESTFQAEVLYQLARVAQLNGQAKRAEQVVQELKTKHAGSPWAQQAALLLGSAVSAVPAQDGAK